MIRIVRAFALCAAALGAGAASAQQETSAAPGQAVGFEEYLAEHSRQASAGVELPDLNLGGYGGSRWGEPGTAGEYLTDAASILGHPARRDVRVDARGAVRSVRWHAPSGPDGASMLRALTLRYGPPSTYSDGPPDEAVWIGARSTLTYRSGRDGDWTLELAPTH